MFETLHRNCLSREEWCPSPSEWSEIMVSGRKPKLNGRKSTVSRKLNEWSKIQSIIKKDLSEIPQVL